MRVVHSSILITCISLFLLGLTPNMVNGQHSDSTRFQRSMQYGGELSLSGRLLKWPENSYYYKPQDEVWKSAFYYTRFAYPALGAVVRMRNSDVHTLGITYHKTSREESYLSRQPWQTTVSDFILYYQYQYCPLKKWTQKKWGRVAPFIGGRLQYNNKHVDTYENRPPDQGDQSELKIDSYSSTLMLQAYPSIRLVNEQFFAELGMAINLLGWYTYDYHYRYSGSGWNNFSNEYYTFDDRNNQQGSDILTPSDLQNNGYLFSDLVLKIGFVF
ncbi:hypothetical protein KFE98_12325 [bacterium SCSIO 12741]|nr:hypothetical protein KFE98_12325 [bacterium SCSIO 12741]